MGNQDIDKYISDILSDMLETYSQILKENDNVTLENNSMSDDDDVLVGVVNNRIGKRKSTSKGNKDYALEDVEKMLRHC